MACKYYRGTWFADYCTAKGKEEKVTYAHAKEYCRNCRHEKCNAYKNAGSFLGGLFGW